MLTAIKALLLHSIALRQEFLSPPHDKAFRLFNGFTEGVADLTVDIFAATAVIHDYGRELRDIEQMKEVADFLMSQMPFVTAVLLKRRNSQSQIERNGIILRGTKLAKIICEHGVRYAVDLMLNRDNSFYADTRNLRKFLLENSLGKRVLNTFAYTGSLGVAAAAGGADFVLQTDLSDRFMEIARRSLTLNKSYFNRKNFIAGDFFPVVARLKRAGELFDTVILDPPFFSKTANGTVDQALQPSALINKVRPLVTDGGILVAVNNSLYLSGADFMRGLEELCDGHYLTLEKIIPVPEDFTGYGDCSDKFPVSPEPFNFPTKIVLLRVRRKVNLS